jgi:hypothetical protein
MQSLLRWWKRAYANELALGIQLTGSRPHSASPLPYFALSWQITGFAHDIAPELAAQVLDFLLVDGQSGVLYLTVAVSTLASAAAASR